MREYGAPLLREQFGQLDDNGREVEFYYELPGHEPVKLTQAFLSRFTFRPELRGQDMVRVETATLKVDRLQLEKRKVRRVSSRATVKIGEDAWNIDEETTIWGPTFVVIGLKREPLTAANTIESDGNL